MSKTLRSAVRDWWGADSSPLPRMLCGGATLAFLAYPAADLLSGRLAGVTAIAAATGLAAFAAVYLHLFWIFPEADEVKRVEASASVIGLAALAVALALGIGSASGAEDSWTGPFVYVAVAAALALPIRFAIPGVFAVAAIALVVTGGIGAVALQALFFGLLLVMVRGQAALVDELDAARGQVADLAVNEERLRMSRELHDLLGHNLSLIALKSELARKLIGRDPDAAAREARDVESVARQSLQEARDAVRGLRSASLAAELDRAREALEAARIEVVVRTAGPLPGRVEATLGAAVREAATNVLRHSRARSCELVVRRRDRVAEVEVRDDGRGAPDSGEDGSGLRGLAERMAEAGGTLDAGPLPDGGFRLVARVPLPRVGPDESEAAPEFVTWIDPVNVERAP